MFKFTSCITLMLLSLMAAANGYADTSIINEYDANGNLVTGDGRYYEYNDANQLVKVRQGVDQTGPVIAEYFYDFSGQRVKKIENGVVTYYVGRHFEKQVGGSNDGNTSYYFGDGGERVAKKDPAGNIFYYHLDHLDGVNAVTDSAGTVVAKTDYLPFGDVREGSTGSEKYSYTGKEKDKTDLYYFDARYNSPEFRHFTQADMAEPDFADPQDLNRYAYVGNNPLSYVDPDGFKKKKKKHLSKRERRAIALGLNPDKDKYKVGKMSDREFKRALKAHSEIVKKSTTVAKSATSQGNNATYSSADEVPPQFASSTARSMQGTIINLEKAGFLKTEITNDKAKLCNNARSKGCFNPTSRTMYISTEINSKPVEAELTFAHESQHALDTFGRSDKLNLFDRIVLEERARVTETKVWEELGEPNVSGWGEEWGLRNPKTIGWLQGFSNWLDE